MQTSISIQVTNLSALVIMQLCWTGSDAPLLRGEDEVFGEHVDYRRYLLLLIHECLT